MAATESVPSGNAYPDPDAPEFSPIRAGLARLYMRHRVDLGIALASDEWIIEHTTDLSAALYFLCKHAHQHGDYAWLSRHRWWLDATTRLFNDEPAVPLDG